MGQKLAKSDKLLRMQLKFISRFATETASCVSKALTNYFLFLILAYI
jgi:hypothetical protein